MRLDFDKLSRAPICLWRAMSSRDLRLGIASALLFTGCSASEPLTMSTTRPTTAPALDAEWVRVSQTLGRRGVVDGDVYTITIPRDDLEVRIEGMEVPTRAGLQTTFWFYRCSCGKTAVVGQFVVTDYEVNDVVYALQKENILVSTVAPLLMYDKPRMMLVRFQAEGQAEFLARALQSALQWTGKQRMAPQKTSD